MAVNDIRTVTGGLNTDDSLLLVPPEDYTDGENLRESLINAGSLESILGNTIIPTTVIDPLAQNTVLGSCENKETNSILGFIYSEFSPTLYGSIIVEYSHTTKTLTKILETNSTTTDYLNFHPDYKIIHPVIMDDNLIWTDNYNEPRMINITKARNYTLNLTPGTKKLTPAYTTINNIVLDFAKHPPIKAPICVYENDITDDFNNLRSNLYQFSYRWIYSDKGESVYSDVSLVPIRTPDEFVSGHYVLESYVNNRIKITLQTGDPDVETIEVIWRNSNTGEWLLVERIEKYDRNGNVLIASNISYDCYFKNDNTRTAVTGGDTAFSYVPQKAKYVELIEDSRVSFANYIEGYDNIDIDVEIDVGNMLEHQYPNATAGKLMVDKGYTGIAFYTFFSLTFLYSTIGFEFVITVFGDGGVYDRAVVLNNKSNFDDFFDELKERVDIICQKYKLQQSSWEFGYLDFAPPPPTPHGYYFVVPCQHNYYPYKTISPYKNAAVHWSRITDKILVQKTGAKHRVGIVYFDSLKRMGAVNNKGTVSVNGVSTGVSEYYIPFPTQEKSFWAWQYNSAFYFKPSWVIRHLAPVWAKYWSWVYTKNTSMSFWLQFPIMTIGLSEENVYFSVNYRINNWRDRHPRLNIEPWVFAKGDRVRFLCNTDDITGTNYVLTEYLDFEIEGTKEINTYDCFLIQEFNYKSYDISPNTWVEIYRPKKFSASTDPEFYYTVGEIEEVSPEGYHLSKNYTSQHLDPSGTLVPASGKFDFGDAYILCRNVTVAFAHKGVESPDFSDYYDSDVYNIGRPNMIDRNYKQVELKTGIRYGGKYIRDTNINRLAEFDYDDNDTVSEEYGEITGVRQVGFTLKVIQNHKLTSIYIGREQIKRPGGGTDMIIVDNVLGSHEVSEESYGTYFPESVVVNQRHLYFYDHVNMAVVRDAPNGKFPISKYKVDEWFKTKSAYVAEHIDDMEIRAFYDKKYDEYGLTFCDKTFNYDSAEYNPTMIFHEPSNRWKPRRNFFNYTGTTSKPMISGYQTLGGLLFSWDGNANLYIHDSGQYNVFYGIYKNPKIQIPSNIDPLKIKIFLACDVYSDKEWTNLDTNNVETEPNAMYPDGMQSRTKTFRGKEGIYHADIMRDKNDIIQGTEKYKLINGRRVRGQACKITLYNESSDKVILNSLIIRSITSERSKQ